MTSVTHTSSRVLALVGLIVALALTAPAALARASQRDNGPLDPWAYALVHRSSAESQQYGPLDPWAYAVIHRGNVSGSSVVPAIKSDNGGGMDWGDAGVGAAGAFGLVVLLAGATFAVRKRATLARPRF